jgi:drug/metabolite transporter (DMT)-like permease
MGPMTDEQRLTLPLLIALGIVWGSAFIAIRYVLDAGASPFLFVVVRMGTQAPLMALIALLAREKLPSRRDLAVSAVLGGALVMGGYQTLLFWGEQFTSGGLAGVLVAGSPLMTAILTTALLPSERFGRSGIVGLLVGFVGVALLFEPDLASGAGSTTLGLVAVLGAAFAFALGSVLLRKWRKGGESSWGASVEFAAGGLFALPFMLAYEPRPAFPVGEYSLLATAYLVVAAGVLGFVVYFHLHHRVGPARANLVSFVSPVAALGFGVLLLGETYAWVQLGGFGLIVLGLYLLQRDRARKAASAGATPEAGPLRPSSGGR